MLVPMIHRWVSRNDMAAVLAEIARVDRGAADHASAALRHGDVDAVLDLPITLDVVRGMGGRPAPLPLSILWYVPVRASLRERGEHNLRVADFAATIPVAFHSMAFFRKLQRGESDLASWKRSVTSLPRNTIVRAERSAQLAAVALWWVGCFPERVESRGGPGMLRAYVDFAAAAFAESSRTLKRESPDASDIYRMVSTRAQLVANALAEVKSEYLNTGPEDHLDRFLSRVRPAN